METGPGQAYSDGKGGLLLFCCHETRAGIEGTVLIGARRGVPYSRFFPANTTIPYELVNDTAGRAEAQVHAMYADQVKRENEVLLECMKEAIRRVSASDARELKDLWVRLANKK